MFEEIIELPEILNLKEYIDYQEGSVVSRMLINKPEGSITIFAFDKGESLSEHATPFDAFVYLIEGKAEIIISGKSHILEEGQMIIMPANEPHALKALERYKMMLVMIKSKF
ncbi:MAG: cupin domain-containing protein [Candidatus Helarchaeota archaeon]